MGITKPLLGTMSVLSGLNANVTDGIAIYLCFGSSRQITIASGMRSVKFKNGRKEFGSFYKMKM